MIRNLLRIKYISNLHIGYIKSENITKYISQIKPNNNIDALILTGEIGNPYSKNYDKFINYVNNNFKKTFIIAGYNEYYGNNKSIIETNEFMANYFNKFENVSYLNNNYEDYNGYCFIGSTLWSQVKYTHYKMNDRPEIKGLEYEIYSQMNNSCIDFLYDTMNKKKDKKCIIMTHHLPSEKLFGEKYIKECGQWFFTNMEEFLMKYNESIKGWFCGHTFIQNDIIINNVRILCNPIGYVGQYNIVDFNKIVEL